MFRSDPIDAKSRDFTVIFCDLPSPSSLLNPTPWELRNPVYSLIQYLHFIWRFPYICSFIHPSVHSFIHWWMHPSAFHSHSTSDPVWLSLPCGYLVLPSLLFLFFSNLSDHSFLSLLVDSLYGPLYKCGCLTLGMFCGLPHPALALLPSQWRQLCSPVLDGGGELARVLLSH